MKKVISIALVVMMLVSLFGISVSAEPVKGWQDDVKTIGVELTDAAEFNILGHWLDKDEFVKVTDWYENGKSVYMQRIAPVDNEGAMMTFSEGESFVFNYELYKTFTEENVELLNENVEVAAYLFGAENKGGETGEFRLLNEYRGYQSSVSAAVEAPFDNFTAAVVFVVENADLTEFGSFVTFSASAKGYMALDEAENLDLAAELTFDVTAEETDGVILPFYGTYAIAKAAAYKMEVTEPAVYNANISTENLTGFRAYFTDENYDVINQTYITGAEEAKEATLTMNAMVPGTYYFVIAGNNLDNRGTVKVAFEKVEITEVTDLDITNATEDVVLSEAGRYNVIGTNNDVKLYIGSGAEVTLDNATVGGIVLINTEAPVVLNLKGMNYVNAQAEGYGITNAEGANSGLYIIGDVLKVSSTVETKGAILMHDAPLHIDAIKVIVKAEKVEGYYPVGIWVVGKNLPKLTISDEMTINHNLDVAPLVYSDYFAYGFTVAAAEVVADFTEAAVDFVISKYPLGDVNLDKVVDTTDVTMVLQYCAGIIEFDEIQLYMGDVNYDLKVNTYDAVMMLKLIAQLITEF